MKLSVLPSLVFGIVFLSSAGCSSIQRPLLFFPTHHTKDNELSIWQSDHGEVFGYSRQVESPDNVWLMLHGNGGQAADRAYALDSFSDNDSIFILEYPGYGARRGKPSKRTIDAAATEAYLSLRRAYPNTPVCAVGESIGSGPTCKLAMLSLPPDKIVLIVPFDTLTSVAAEKVGTVVAGLILEAKWNNIRSLSTNERPVEIFGAEGDSEIPVEHAKALAESVPAARFHLIPGGHNDWPNTGHVQIRNP